MRTFIADIIPKIQQYSKKLDDLTKLQNQHWVSIGEISDAKTVYIFRDNNQLLISENGRVQKGTWEYLGNQSLLIETPAEMPLLLKHGFFDENVIALKLDSTNTYAFFVNESKYDSELNSIDDIVLFLTEKYIKRKQHSSSNNVADHQTSRLDSKIRYRITNEEKKSAFLTPTYWQYEVTYEEGIVGYFYKKDGSDSYSYVVINGISTLDKYCNSKEEVIKELYYYLKKFK